MSTDGGMLGYAELLRLATTHGLQELDCSIVQIPEDGNGNHAIVMAAARTTKGFFRAIGEARTTSLPAALQEVTLTVAEQQAKTRALSEAVGLPHVLQVESGTVGLATPVARNPAPHQDAPPAAAPEKRTVIGESDNELMHLEKTPAAVPANVVAATKRSTSESHADAGSAPVLPNASTLDSSVVSASRAPAQKESEPAKHLNPVPFSEGLGPDVLARLLDMTRKKAIAEGSAITEEDAMRRLDSFFQRAFGHPISEGSRMEGQRVVQRLASDLARLGAESGHAHAMRG